MNGIVYKSTGSWYVVKGEDQQFYECRLKGRFRLKEIKNTREGGNYRDCSTRELYHSQVGKSLQTDTYPCGKYRRGFSGGNP